MNDKALFKEYWQFLEGFWLGFWVPAFVDHAFGRVMITFQDERIAQLAVPHFGDGWSFEEVLRVVEGTAKKWDYKPGVHFNAHWDPKLKQDFEAFIIEKGYEPLVTMVNFKLKAAQEVPKKLNIVEVTDAALIIDLFKRSFQPHTVRAQLLNYNIQNSKNRVQNRFFVGYDGDIPVGLVATAHDGGEIGFWHTLGVVPEAQGNGYSKELVNFAGRVLNEHGAQHIFSATTSNNERSMAMHVSSGYEPFDEWYLWVNTRA